MNESEVLKVGTRIEFKKTLSQGPCEDSPGLLFARKGEQGEITGHGCHEGYWVKRDNWPSPFGCERENFMVIK